MNEVKSMCGTSTSDSACGVRKILVRAEAPRRAAIVLRDFASQRWWSAGGCWVSERGRAVRFSSNLDALLYCRAVGVVGVVEAFDASGGRLYELNAGRILEALAELHTPTGVGNSGHGLPENS